MLRNRRFLRLWSAHATNTLGDEVYALAVPLIALQIGGTAPVIALLTACALLPHVVFGFVGGVYADRADRFRILRISYIASFAILLVALAVFASSGRDVRLATLAATALALAAVAAFSTASVDSLIPSCVDANQLARANSSTEAVRTVATVAGPAVAGLLVAKTSPHAAIALNALSFLFAFSILRGLTASRPAAASQPAAAAAASNSTSKDKSSVLSDLREGLLYLRRHRPLFVGVILSTVANLVFGAYEAILIFHVSRDVGLSAAGIGLLFAAAGGVSVVTAAVLSWKAPSRDFARVMTASIALQGVGAAVTATSGLFTVVLGQMLVSATTVSYTVYWRSFRQSVCDPALLGRVSGACRSIAYAGAFIGALLSSLLLDLVDDVALLLLYSGLTVAVIGVVGHLLLIDRPGPRGKRGAPVGDSGIQSEETPTA
ncbi:MFS transporter [Streptomyces sp. NPDC020880]|uniref:MFS transporter n=1 Tax=Streptomyces sp. NPDC020880 TaxID=3365098 RepID=UPI0038501150